MKFILNSLNYSPELTGIGKYNGEMCSELLKRGVDISAVVAPPYYPEWEVHQGFSSWQYKTEYKEGVDVIRCPLYVPNNVTNIKRIIHLSTFAMSSGFALFTKLFTKPDIVFLVQPTLFCAPMVLLFAKLTGAKSILHIQDYEIDAMFGLGMMGEGDSSITSFIKSIESWLMKRFDAISTISYSMIDNAVSKGVSSDKMIYFPNWSDTQFVTPEIDGLALKKEWGFTEEDRVILYAGNIGKKQGLEVVLEAAKFFEMNNNVKFLFVGTGSHADLLKQQAITLQLKNVYFLPLQPWERVPEMLALADIHLVVQRKGVSEAVLPSKLTNILSAGGRALVTAEPATELFKLAEKHPGIFHCVEAENTKAFINGLTFLLSESCTGHNTIAREFANEFLSKDKILDQFFSDVKKLVNDK